MMPFLLLVAAMVATVSSVSADEYLERIECNNADSRDSSTYCYINYQMGPKDMGYYKLVLIQDLSTSDRRCAKDFFQLEKHNDRPAVRVTDDCHGLFGLTVKVAGYPYKGGCGQNNGLSFKIINGFKAPACRFPWMAYVRKDWESRRERGSCGGSIVADRWILTASHCIINQYKDGARPPARAMIVRTGSLDKWADYIERPVDWVLTHPEYDYKYLHNDIALLRLAKPIKYDGCHASVCLNNDTKILERSWCFISGWGKSSISSNRWPRMLLWSRDYMLSRKECDKIYGGTSRSSTVCGRATGSGRRGFCSGDSGGPLVCKHGDRFYQHGVVSLYRSNRACRMEGLYTRVAYFYDWIMSYIQ